MPLLESMGTSSLLKQPVFGQLFDLQLRVAEMS